MRQNDFFANVLRACIDWPLHRQEAASISKTSDLKVLQKKKQFSPNCFTKIPFIFVQVVVLFIKGFQGKS